MSKRHHADETPEPPRQERRARARGERHRVNGELNGLAEQLAGGTDPVDLTDPAPLWKPTHHHDSDKARAQVTAATRRRRRRHWKLKMWKRRTAARRAKVQAERELGHVEP